MIKKWYYYEIIIYYFQIVLKIARIRIQGLLDPDPDSIEYGSETLLVAVLVLSCCHQTKYVHRP